MAFLMDLWLPVLVSAALVFFSSSIMHMVLPFHKKDYRQFDNEDELLSAMRPHKLPPGDYVFPFCVDMKERKTEAMQTKLNEGPVGFMTVLPNGPWEMGKSLLQWFLFTVLIGVFVAYVLYHALPESGDYLTVFRLVAVVSFLPYALGGMPNSIWKGLSWATTGRFVFDGIIYSLLTAGAFAWLWGS